MLAGEEAQCAWSSGKTPSERFGPRTQQFFTACVGFTLRKATALAIGQVCPGGHPIPAVGEPSSTAAFGGQGVHLWGHFPDGGT